jgi:hypothetical protein
MAQTGASGIINGGESWPRSAMVLTVGMHRSHARKDVFHPFVPETEMPEGGHECG